VIDLKLRAQQVIERCRAIARHSEEPHRTTRTFLSPPMHDVHREIREWMEPLGAKVAVDAAGNVHGFLPGTGPGVLIIGSHIDTVPGAGAFDGVLGVVLAIELLRGGSRSFSIEVVAFSEEEGVRFGVPFIGSRALLGTVDSELLGRKDSMGISVEDAIRAFGLDPSQLPGAVIDPKVMGYFEIHIEQGPVLESLDAPLAVVEAIAGQSRLSLRFRGQANHAGTTPMHLRRDALAAAAEWITFVERQACATDGLVATVGRIEAKPGAGNVVPGEIEASLDVRHADDATRTGTVIALLQAAGQIAERRRLEFTHTVQLDQPAVPCDRELTSILERAMQTAGYPVHRLTSGAGHDAMILAPVVPATMLFLRSPGGISHHPGENVFPDDVEAALRTSLYFLDALERRIDHAPSGTH
jgi:allantoate deiminase